jgi:predicted TIM-barrel fold metal-dependent hydrolase
MSLKDLSVIDADGHVLEDEAIKDYIAHNTSGTNANRTLFALFPSIDRLHTGIFVRNPMAFGGGKRVGPKEWGEFADEASIRYSALYPSAGLAMGNIAYGYWAEVAARSYNDWLYGEYTSKNARLKGVALLPMQDPQAAVDELRRAKKELGFIGAMLPANGLQKHLGDKSYWPIYEEALRLDMPLAVHGGNHAGYGMDGFECYTPINGLGHPFGQMVAMSSLVFHNVFDEFPTLRVAFLEAGSAWVGLWIDRMDRTYAYHIDLHTNGKPYTLGLKKPSDYFKTGRVFVGCEGSEASLPAQIKRVGNGLFLFASDFPHEVSAQDCLHEIDEIVEDAELTEADKRAVLSGNAERFYNYTGADIPQTVGAKA